jgi:phosphatidylserine/phosphatidylglycerophosphate/cardiolipin synthase-like enzyme
MLGCIRAVTKRRGQQVSIELRRETYPGKINVAFTRGFVSSQAFVDRYVSQGPISTLLPSNADEGLTFVPTHPLATEALAWMGFEARQVKVIIDDDGSHGQPHSGETQAAQRLAASAGAGNVKRQHMGQLQHNKTIVVDGPKVQAVVCGSTNFSWRGFFVQSNNALVLRGINAVKLFLAAFDDYWTHGDVAGFGKTASAKLAGLGFTGIDVRVAFSPHSSTNALLATVADDIGQKTTSNLFYSLAFLYQTPGPILDAIKKVTNDDKIFVYGISDRKVGGIDLQKPDGNVAPVFPANLQGNLPEPFKSEPTGGSGVRMHHKFVVIDFEKPTARVYMGSYNFSSTADIKNGENLLVIRDRRIAVSYLVEGLSIFDHYHFRVLEQEAKDGKRKLQLAKPPRNPGEKPWWDKDYTNAHKIRDRELFA